MSNTLTPVEKAPFVVARGPLRDLVNRMTHGAQAPRAQERIWVDPRAITRIYTRNAAVTPDFRRRHTAMVVSGEWDRQTEPLDQSWKIAACLARFRDGVPWEDTGVFAHMTREIAARGVFDSCRSEANIRARYAGIDALYAQIRDTGYRDDTVVSWGHPRLPEGIFIHLDRHGSPIFGAIGNHRMAIARALNLPRIPVQLGVVHPDALGSDALHTLRQGGV